MTPTTTEERRNMLAAMQTSSRPYDGQDEVEETESEPTEAACLSS